VKSLEQAPQAAIGRRHDPDINATREVAPDPLNDEVLDRSQQLRLCEQRQIRHIVQE
jgi:hypothetical protein